MPGDWFNHYFLASKAWALFHSGKTDAALRSAREAFHQVEDCPWAIDIYLTILEDRVREKRRKKDAAEYLRVYDAVLQRGQDAIVTSDCSQWNAVEADEILNDFHFLSAFVHDAMGDRVAAITSLAGYIAGRKSGLSSDYTLTEARQVLREWTKAPGRPSGGM